MGFRFCCIYGGVTTLHVGRPYVMFWLAGRGHVTWRGVWFSVSQFFGEAFKFVSLSSSSFTFVFFSISAPSPFLSPLFSPSSSRIASFFLGTIFPFSLPDFPLFCFNWGILFFFFWCVIIPRLAVFVLLPPSFSLV